MKRKLKESNGCSASFPSVLPLGKRRKAVPSSSSLTTLHSSVKGNAIKSYHSTSATKSPLSDACGESLKMLKKSELFLMLAETKHGKGKKQRSHCYRFKEEGQVFYYCFVAHAFFNWI
ncbi:hypothetical protein HPP92_027474 [Vanilla planifolia]|uniref:Uncharacterized protein n=1 Tax=Vanilla planifolia TaxID=51239 RepID=A0A835U4E5_VANPL|nr:hypothetical protein HPP92_027474 [Vanilla planifolia]KAG0449169.1 hypothetical protein HPP92_027492 [Vanilla planifolia]